MINRRGFMKASLLAVTAFLGADHVSAATTPPVYFARVMIDGADVYKKVNGEYVVFYPSRNPIYKYSLLRLYDVGEGFAQVIDDPEPGFHGYSPWRSRDGVESTFVRIEGLVRVTDFSAVNVYPETQPEDKLIVVNLRSCEVALFEGSRLVLMTPVVVGNASNGKSLSLAGFGHLCVGYTTRTMGDYAGVPYPLYVYMVDQEFNGEALHGTFWRAWDGINSGFWGSKGCINLPVSSKYDVVWGSRRISIDEFVFRWSKTNLRFDPYTQEGVVVDQRIFLGTRWFAGTETMRRISVYSYDEMDYYPDGENRYHTWGPIIETLQRQEGRVLLPDMDVNGVLTFRQKPASELP